MAVMGTCSGYGYPTLGRNLCAFCRSVEVIAFDQSGVTVQEPATQPAALRKRLVR
jgi:hypothetical protein